MAHGRASAAALKYFGRSGSGIGCRGLDTVGKIFDPIAKNDGCDLAERQIRPKREFRKLDAQRDRSLGNRSFPVVHELVLGSAIEITRWHSREIIAVAR